MSRWPTKSLAEACRVVTDGSHRTPPFTEPGFPFVTVAHVNDEGQINFAACKKISATDYQDLKKNDCRPLPGDVLFSKDGTVGKVALIDFDADFAVLSSLAILRPDKAVLKQRYLGYALRSGVVLSQALDRKSGTAIRRIVLRDLAQVRVPVPPLPEQERIVRVLDQADELRKLRREADRRTADLIPALFHDMFGDPATNPKGWPRIEMADVVTSVSDGPHVSPQYTASGIPFLSTRHIRATGVEWTDLKFISPEDAAVHWRKCRPERGDILYTKGGTTGIAAVVDFDEPFAVWVHVALLKTRTDVVEPLWLESMLNSSYCYRQSQELTHGIANRDLGLTRMVRISMYLPPVVLQREFSRCVAVVRGILAKQAKSRGRTNDLFESLLHRAFEGEL